MSFGFGGQMAVAKKKAYTNNEPTLTAGIPQYNGLNVLSCRT